MKNFVQPANTIPLTAPKALVSGEGVFIGKIFAICTVDTASGKIFQGAVEGGVSLKRAVGYAQPAQGTAVVFDATAQTLISGAGTAVGYTYGADPDDATRALVKLVPVVV